MKFSKKLFLILTLLFSCLTFSQTTPKIIGEWIGKDYTGNEGKFIFYDDNFASMTIGGEFIDGKNYKINGGKNDGKTAMLKYIVDYSTNPISIDFIALLIENKKEVEKGRILAIAKFINDSEMKLSISITGKRDKDFNVENFENTIVLKRN